MKRVIISFQFLVLVLTTSSFAQEKRIQAYRQFDPGAPIHYPRNLSFHVENYKLNLSFDFASGKVMGTDTITLRPYVDKLERVVLDSSRLDIEKVLLGGATPLKYRTDSNHLYIDLGRTYGPSDQLSIEITYNGTPPKGLYFIRHDEAYPNRADQIWSQGEQEDNHYWFPCFDYPNDKATSELIATVPGKWQVISNGKLVKETTNSDGTKTFDWVESIPHSTYLTSIVAGPFTKVEQEAEGKPVTYYVPPGVDRETTLRSFGLTPDMIKVYSRLTGVPYPYDKYAQSAVAQFVAGGMENISATTQTDTTLHDAAAEADHFSSQGLVAHELAHQWFGDLLTTQDWANIWLNEGFATFMEAQYTLEHDGLDEYRYEIFRNGETNQAEDRERYRRPIVDRRYGDNQHMFDRTTYQKGSVVLDMLTYVIGRDTLFRGLHHYLDQYRAKNVNTHDLIKALGEGTGQSLDWFFDEWVYGAGYPQYKVTATWDPESKLEHLRVVQTQVLQAHTPLFKMPVDISITTASGTKDYKVTSEGKEQDFYFPADSYPLMVLFDSGDHILKTLAFDKTEGELIYQIKNDPSLVGRIWAIRELAKKSGDAQSVAALSQALSSDKFWGVRLEAAKALGSLGSDGAVDALVTSKPDADSRVRESVIEALGSFQNNQKAIQGIEAAWKSDDSYRVDAAAVRALAQVKAPDAFDVCKAALSKPSYRDMIASGGIRGLVELHDKRALPLIIEETKYGKPDSLRQAGLFALASLGRGNTEAYDTIAEATHDPYLFIRVVAYTALGVLGDKRAVPLLTRAASSEVDPQAADAANQALRRLNARGEEGAAQLQEEVRALQRRNQDLEQRVRALEKHEH